MANIQNLASGILAEDLTASATVVPVNVGSGSATVIKAVWPTAPFYVTVMPNSPVVGVANSLDSEVMLVTAVGNDQVGNVSLTVTRAQKNTSAKTFSAGAVVTNGIYAEDIAPQYSDTETATLEKWIDGETIYKTTVSFGALPNTGTKVVSHGIAGINQVVKIEGIASTASGNYTALPFTPSAPGSLCDLIVSKTNISMTAADNRSGWSGYITIYYTKTS